MTHMIAVSCWALLVVTWTVGVVVNVIVLSVWHQRYKDR